MKKYLKITLILSIFILIFFSYFILLSPTLIGNVIRGTEHAYTRAICNQGKCEDYFIECVGKKLAKTSFTGHSIKNNDYPIHLIDQNKLCN